MSSYLTPLMWSFLPGKITEIILPTLSSTFPALLPPAQRGSDPWRANYRRVLTAVVVLALAYNFATQAAGGMDWYDLLGVGPRAGDDELRRAFRQLSRKYHPDRLGPNPPRYAEERFIAIRQAYEILTDPVKRFAYDRFGPSIATWQKVENTREYVSRGAQSSVGFYIGSIGFMLVLALLGRAQQGAYWRNVLLGVLLIFETTLILAPTPAPGAPLSSEPVLLPIPRAISSVIALIIPRSILQRPAYRHIALFHRLFTDASIAISQLAAEWSHAADAFHPQRVMQLAGLVNGEAMAALSDEVGPVLAGTNDPSSAERNLLERMENVYLTKTLEHHPAIEPAWSAAMAREHVPKHAPVQNTDATPNSAVSSNTRRTRGSTPRTRRTPAPEAALSLDAAAHTPLPPSPPETPFETGGPRRRSARLGSVQ